MKNFIYNTPTKVFFGDKEEQRVGKIISDYGFKKILFHYGKSSIKTTGLYDVICQSLKDNNIEFIELGGCEPNPKLSLVHQGIEIIKKNRLEMILAVGGGSVIDSAKLMSDGAKVDFDPWKFSCGEKICQDHLPLGVVLTISASGSAMSNSCVITNEKIQSKKGFNSEENRPLFAILNPKLTYTVSKYQTACGIVDIMMHTLERFLCKGSGFAITDNLALGLLKVVKEQGLIAYHYPEDYEARSNLMWAEVLSHNSLTGCGNDYVFTIHPLEHEISGLFDRVSHAAGLSSLFGGYSRTILDKCCDKYAILGTALFDIDASLPPMEIAERCIEEFEKFFKSIDMPTSLSDLEIPRSSYEIMANKLTNNKSKVIHSVIDIDYDVALKIYQNCE